jgi:hypothetical protein
MDVWFILCGLVLAGVASSLQAISGKLSEVIELLTKINAALLKSEEEEDEEND